MHSYVHGIAEKKRFWSMQAFLFWPMQSKIREALSDDCQIQLDAVFSWSDLMVNHRDFLDSPMVTEWTWSI